MVKHTINIKVEYDVWIELKNKGYNISEICNDALSSRLNNIIMTTPKIDLNKEEENTLKALEDAKNNLSLEKNEKILALELKLSKITEEKKQAKRREIDSKRKELTPIFTREAIKNGILKSIEINEYVEKKFKELEES